MFCKYFSLHVTTVLRNGFCSFIGDLIRRRRRCRRMTGGHSTAARRQPRSSVTTRQTMNRAPATAVQGAVDTVAGVYRSTTTTTTTTTLSFMMSMTTTRLEAAAVTSVCCSIYFLCSAFELHGSQSMPGPLTCYDGPHIMRKIPGTEGAASLLRNTHKASGG